MENVKYSVIIPVYNAEKTLHRCLDSLVNQNYENAEIILVNDGSRDSSSSICQSYADTYPQIVFISKENGGVSSARNCGIEKATGKYITFVDSDDYVSENYFSQMDAVLNAYDYDYVMFSNCKVNYNKKQERIYKPFSSTEKEDSVNKIADIIADKTINYPWGKIFKRDIIINEQIRFPDSISIAEDRAFNIAYAMHVCSLCVSGKLIYYVCTENINSLSRSVGEKITEQMVAATVLCTSYIRSSRFTDFQKETLLKAVNYGTYREVYAEDKRMIIRGVSKAERRQVVIEKCKRLSAESLPYPSSLKHHAICLPIKFKMFAVIDIVAKKLAKA